MNFRRVNVGGGFHIEKQFKIFFNIYFRAIASSAPVSYFENVPNPPYTSYYDIILRTFSKNGCTMRLLTASFDAIRTMAKTRMKLI